ncbi:lysophospholipid acyltransferase family protein [Patescibacteria group bacterium]
MKILSSLIYYPLRNIRIFIAHPINSSRNIVIIAAAFWRTAVVATHIRKVLLSDENADWSVKERGTYVWYVARKYWAKWILDFAGIKLEVNGAEKIDWSRYYIIIPNHNSTLDLFIIIALIENGRIVAKKEVLGFPFVGPALRKGGQIVIDRSNHKQAMEAIRKGMRDRPDCHTVFFAEGTRSPDGTVKPFKFGAFSQAKELGQPIAPVFIEGTFDALPKGSLLRLKRNSRVKVTFRNIIPVSAIRRLDVEDLAIITRLKIMFGVSVCHD